MKNISGLPVHRFDAGTMELHAETLASECLIHIQVNKKHVTSLLASPENLHDLVAGHLRVEYEVPCPQGGHYLHISSSEEEFTVDVNIDGEFDAPSRSTIVTTSCGGCEQDRLSALVEQTPSISCSLPASPIEPLIEALHSMRSKQPGFEQTGGMHAAGLFFGADEPLVVREDIGRHNAVDKVLGAFLTSNTQTLPHGLLLSGRCGWDIVSKAARMNIPIIASIGAASSLAAKTARSSDITLVSFAKNDRAVVIGRIEGRIQRNH